MNYEDELKKLQNENRKLNRELRHTKMTLDKISKITEAKDAMNTALTLNSERQKAYVDLFIDNCPNIIFLLDTDGKFVFTTRIFLEILQLFSFDYIENRSYKDIFPGYIGTEQYNRVSDAIENAQNNNKSIIIDEVISFGESDPRHYSIELLPVESSKGRPAGIVSGILAIFTDTTDFVHEKEKAEAANSAKSDFLATMSHEIRTPMNAIMGLTEILKRSKVTDEQNKYLSDIQSSSDNLLTIINDILDFSKIEAGKIEVIKSNIILPELFNNLHSIFNFMFENKNIKFSYDLDENIPAVINSDEKLINQIVTNVLSNALKYTNEGEVKLKVWVNDPDILRIDVSDTGIGIREADMSNLFQPFEQLDTRKNKNIVGTGLGLAICYRLAHIMGGDLWVDSVYGQGSTFSIGLPFDKADQNWTKEIPQDIANFIIPDAKTLVVDDIEINLSVAKALIETFEIQVDTAISGKEALELVRENEYDIIFMDHMMPEMDGVETTKLIRLMGGYRVNVPIVALTANAISGMKEMFLENSFNDFLPKPLEFDNLKRILLDWMPKEKIVKLSD